MKYISFLSFILLLILVCACNSQYEEDLITPGENQNTVTFSLLTENGPEIIDLKHPSDELLRTLSDARTIAINYQKNAEECTAPCELDRRFVLRTFSQDCGAAGCSYEIVIGVCYLEVSNGTVELFFGDVDFALLSGCEGVDEDCVRAEAISRITAAITNLINHIFPDLPEPIPCGGPTVNWYSTYTETSCASNCEGVDCGTACCQYYTSWCLDETGGILLGQFEGSNQISDCSGNKNLPEGCDCFQSDCENQYNF